MRHSFTVTMPTAKRMVQELHLPGVGQTVDVSYNGARCYMRNTGERLEVQSDVPAIGMGLKHVGGDTYTHYQVPAR